MSRTVECEVCDASTDLNGGVSVTGGSSDDTWTTVTTIENGTIVIMEAHCPEHRLDDKIDKMMSTVDQIGEIIEDSINVADEIEEVLDD